MKITLFIGSLFGGGAERVACNLANHLVKKGYEVDILTMSESKEHYFLESGVSNTVLLLDIEKESILINNLKRWLRFREYLKTKKSDYYVVMLPLTTIMLLFFKKVAGRPIIAAERADPKKYSIVKRLLLKSLAPRASKFVFQTEEARRWYGSSVKKKNAVIIPNAINEEFIRPAYSGERKKVIAGVGRLTDQKNFSLLINAFSLISNKYPDYTLEIYGEGPNKKQLEQQIIEKGLFGRVMLLGHVKHIAEHLESVSMFVLSSDYEGMPNALIEAMALGLPCVTTDCSGGGAKFLIKDGVNGLLVPVRDVEALANAIDRVLSNTEFAVKISKEAKKIIQRLSPNVIYDKWEECIKSIKKVNEDDIL